MDMNEEKILAKMRSEKFIENNGTVLRAINILRMPYNSLSKLRSALEEYDINSADFADSINFLSLSGYIILRRCDTKAPAATSDDSIDDMEAKLSDKGIRLLTGKIFDDCVRT